MELFWPIAAAMVAAVLSVYLSFNPSVLLPGSALYLLIPPAFALLKGVMIWEVTKDTAAIEMVTDGMVDRMVAALPGIIEGEIIGAMAGAAVRPVLVLLRRWARDGL